MQQRRKSFVDACAAFATVALICVSPPTNAPAQSRDLAADLADLDVRHRTEHYALAGTAAESRLVEYGQYLEYIHAEYTSGFESLLEQAERPTRAEPNGRRRRKPAKADSPPITSGQLGNRFKVIILRTQREYAHFARQYIGQGSEFSSGMFIPSLELLLILENKDSEQTYETLFHEAFHQFLRRYVKNPPMWLNEGLATYFGTARPTKSGLVFDHRNDHWDICRKLISSGQAIQPIDLVRASRSEFYDNSAMNVRWGGRPLRRSFAYYAQSYTLIHTLLSGAQSRETLQNYVRDLAADDGRRTNAITKRYFDEDRCARLAPLWVQYVQSRPEQGRR
jgi:hypothetical protein